MYVDLVVVVGYVVVFLFMLVLFDGLLNNLLIVNVVCVLFMWIEGVMVEFGVLCMVLFVVDVFDVLLVGVVMLCGVMYVYFYECDEWMFSIGLIDLMIKLGEFVFIVGGNGSGKIMFVKVLMGFYEFE